MSPQSFQVLSLFRRGLGGDWAGPAQMPASSSPWSQHAPIEFLTQPEKQKLLKVKFSPRKYSELLQKSPLEYQIMHKLIFITVYFTAQMHYFMVRVANFEALYLRHFWVEYKVEIS